MLFCGKKPHCRKIRNCFILGIFYRLGGGKKEDNFGRVEVMIDGEWGSVCSSYFGVNDAKVICKSVVIYLSHLLHL